jgi:hypothetical protein
VKRLSFLLGVIAAAGAVVLLRRRKLSRGEHVDLYYEDGSMISLENGSPDAEQLLSLARDALRAGAR